MDKGKRGMPWPHTGVWNSEEVTDVDDNEDDELGCVR